MIYLTIIALEKSSIATISFGELYGRLYTRDSIWDVIPINIYTIYFKLKMEMKSLKEFHSIIQRKCCSSMYFDMNLFLFLTEKIWIVNFLLTIKLELLCILSTKMASTNQHVKPNTPAVWRLIHINKNKWLSFL